MLIKSLFTSIDFHNANLMILLAYIIIGHKDWKGAEIKIFAVYPEKSIQKERERLFKLIEMGQLPISPNNMELITKEEGKSTDNIITEKSMDADLTILGFQIEHTKHDGIEIFQRFQNIGNVLFVNAADSIEIK